MKCLMPTNLRKIVNFSGYGTVKNRRFLTHRKMHSIFLKLCSVNIENHRFSKDLPAQFPKHQKSLTFDSLKRLKLHGKGIRPKNK